MDKKALMEELEQLGKLFQEGVLSQAEFEAQKTAILGQLQASRGGQTPMPSSVGAGGHGGDVFATGFAGSQGGTNLGVGGVVGERYRLVRELGRGGMGEVWLAEDIRLGRVFALKFLATELVGSSEALSRMHREYEVLEKLTHPHIVRVFDLDQDKGSGRWYLRMEYVEGEDLGKKIVLATEQAERPLFEVERIVGWLGQLVEALDYAHQQGILHRDIKPANLMLTAQAERLKVMDFGIARVVSGTHVTQHTAMMGSMYYAAPELLRGQAATPAADIYSFGVLVYELLTGDLPVGTFWMGSEEDEKQAFGDEKPIHEARITQGFWMGETPVTQGQYQAIKGENSSHFEGANRPVEKVIWRDAAEFANKLSALEGASACFVGTGEMLDGVGNGGSDYVGCKGSRLPTEAEWEYVCRAGTTTPRYGDLDKIAWYDKNSGKTTHPVGEKVGNAWGVYDMLGNVWEWCYDWFHSYPAQAVTDPVGAARKIDRVLRGGSWGSGVRGVRVPRREWHAVTGRYGSLGFRLVSSGL